MVYYLQIAFVAVLVAAGLNAEQSNNPTGQNLQKITVKEIRSARDTYLDAYANSHDSTSSGKSPTGTVDEYRTIEPEAHLDEPHFPYQGPINPQPPGNNYGPPIDQYGPPKGFPNFGPPLLNPGPGYGPPGPAYGPPAPAYGPPAPIYGPPAPVYGPPHPPPNYGVPYHAPGWFDKFHIKLDLFTLAKILLKIIIFKKIVKFIAVICLLLFIPKLAHSGGGDNHNDGGDIMRNIQNDVKPGVADEKLNSLLELVLNSTELYSAQEPDCDSTVCRAKSVLEHVDDLYPYTRLYDMYQNSSEVSHR